MRSDEVSLLDVVKKGDVTASLFTTFNANLKFYEDLVLRRLHSVGCRNNVVLIDQRQCAMAYASAATRPAFAGVAYTLVPVAVSGAFHPKLCLLAGKKRAGVFVGSHNLTISGFAYNQEVTNYLELAGLPGSTEREPLAQAWAAAKGWISAGSKHLPAALLESAYALDDAFGTVSGEASGSTRLLVQSPDGESLLDQFAALAPAAVTRIAVLGAFFDADGAFLEELLRRWPDADVVVGIEPDTVWLRRIPDSKRLRVVGIEGLGRDSKHYMHAKALYMEGRGGAAALASGSANPSAPAWLARRGDANVEAMLFRAGPEAKSGAKALRLDRLLGLPPLNDARLKAAMARSKEAPIESEFALPLLVGIADEEGGRILLTRSFLPAFDRIDALDDDDMPIPGVTLDWSSPEAIAVTGELITIRSLLFSKEVPVARALVHHAASINRGVQRATRGDTADLLRELGSDMADISRVLPLLEKVIFSESVAGVLRVPTARTAMAGGSITATARPDSLGISLADVSRSRKPSFFAASHDIAYLIDILTNHIELAETPSTRGLDRAVRSEQEQIDQDDENSAGLRQSATSATATDSVIGDLVCRRVEKLCNRMSRALKQCEEGISSTVTTLVQVVATLALLQELSRLEQSDRWRIAHVELFQGEDLQKVVDAASDLFLGPEGVLHDLISDPSNTPMEVRQFLALMVWAAWLLDWQWWTPTGKAVAHEDASEYGLANARFLGLLSAATEQAGTWSDARAHIDRTIPSIPLEKAAADRWFERHGTIGQQLLALDLTSETPESGSADEPVVVGDVVSVPNVITAMLVAVSVDASYVEVFTGRGEYRKFQRNRVRKLGRI